MDRSLYRPYRALVLAASALLALILTSPRVALGVRLLQDGRKMEGVVLEVTPSSYVVRSGNAIFDVGKRGDLGHLLMGRRHRRGQTISFFGDPARPRIAREVRFPPGVVTLFSVALLTFIVLALGWLFRNAKIAREGGTNSER